MPYKDPKKRREFNKKPEIKERARKRAAKWRKNHPNYNKHQRELYKKSHASRRATSAEYYKKNKVKINNYNMEKYFEKRDLLLRGYSNGTPKCMCCGVKGNEFLAIDHINGKREMDSEPELKKIGYSSKFHTSVFYNWLIKHNFPKGFQVLCHNCNVAKGNSKDNICPHQK